MSKSLEEVAVLIKSTGDTVFNKRVLNPMGPRGTGFYSRDGSLVKTVDVNSTISREDFVEEVFAIPLGFLEVSQIQDFLLEQGF